MRIDKLRLQNFRKFEDTSIEFHPEFNVLIGENASGKSTILEAIKLGFSIFVYRLAGDSGPLDVRLKKHDVRYSFPQGNSKEMFFPLNLTFWGEVGIAECIPSPWRYKSQSHYFHESSENLPFDYENLPLGPDDVQDLRSQVAKGESVILPLIASYGIPRTEKTEKHQFENIVESRFDPYKDALNATCNAKPFFNWLFRNFLIEIAKKQPSTLLHAVRNAIKQAIPECRDIRYDPEIVEVLVDTERNGQKQTIAFSDLSDGYRGMVGMIADIAHRAARLNPHLGENAVSETPGLVLIDEIDLHLHPKWQRGIVGNLRKIFPKMQFIVTTHSPLIVSEVRPESVIVLKDTENGFEWCPPEESYGHTLNDLVEDLFGDNKRPPEVEKNILELFDAIESGQLNDAKERYEKLKDILQSDTELIKADILISELKVCGGKQ